MSEPLTRQEINRRAAAARRLVLARLKAEKNRLARQAVQNAPGRPQPPIYNPFR